MKKKLNDWFYFNNCVNEKGPSIPLKVIRHGSQVYCSKVKTGVDGLSKQAAIIRSPTIKLDFEKKYLSNNLSKIFHNAHIAWKIHYLKHFIKDESSFTTKKFKDYFSHMESLGDFAFKCCQELVKLANATATEHRAFDEEQVDEHRKKELFQRCKMMKRHGIHYFNTEDDVDVRLRTGDHTAVFDLEKKKKRCCIYCYVTKKSNKRT